MSTPNRASSSGRFLQILKEHLLTGRISLISSKSVQPFKAYAIFSVAMSALSHGTYETDREAIAFLKHCLISFFLRCFVFVYITKVSQVFFTDNFIQPNALENLWKHPVRWNSQESGISRDFLRDWDVHTGWLSNNFWKLDLSPQEIVYILIGLTDFDETKLILPMRAYSNRIWGHLLKKISQ